TVVRQVSFVRVPRRRFGREERQQFGQEDRVVIEQQSRPLAVEPPHSLTSPAVMEPMTLTLFYALPVMTRAHQTIHGRACSPRLSRDCFSNDSIVRPPS